MTYRGQGTLENSTVQLADKPTYYTNTQQPHHDYVLVIVRLLRAPRQEDLTLSAPTLTLGVR